MGYRVAALAGDGGARFGESGHGRSKERVFAVVGGVRQGLGINSLMSTVGEPGGPRGRGSIEKRRRRLSHVRDARGMIE